MAPLGVPLPLLPSPTTTQDAKTSQHAHALQALRREVRAAETAAQDASNDAAVARAAAQRREEELLNESSELQRALAQAQAVRRLSGHA